VGGEVREEVVVGVKEEDVVEVTVFEGVLRAIIWR